MGDETLDKGKTKDKAISEDSQDIKKACAEDVEAKRLRLLKRTSFYPKIGKGKKDKKKAKDDDRGDKEGSEEEKKLNE